MNYEKQKFVDGEVLTAEQLNRIEDALARIAASTSNPNLLDNWYFDDPINQRGQMEYAAAGYTIDRWANSAGSAITTLTEDGIVFSQSATSRRGLIQYIENYGEYIGKTLTFSALVKVNSERFQLGVSVTSEAINIGSDYFNNAGFELVQYTFTVPAEATLLKLWLATTAGGTFTVKAAKLELGTQQTLARQENGVWVLNDPPPNKQQELAKCQRYFQRISNKSSGTSIVGSGQVESTGSVLINIPVPVTMRALAAITAKGVRVRAAGESYLTLAEDYTFGGQRLNTNSIQFSISTTTNVSGLAGKPIVVSLTAETTPSYIDFSADL